MFIIIPDTDGLSYLIHDVLGQTLYFRLFGLSSINIDRDWSCSSGLTQIDTRFQAHIITENDLPDFVKNALAFYKVNGCI